MKRAVLVLALILLAFAPTAAQQGDEIAFTDPPTRSAAAGPGDRGQRLVAGVYLLMGAEDPHRAGAYGTLNSLVTFNADGCSDSTPLFDGVVHVVAATNGAAHGTWFVNDAGQVSASLYYFSVSKAGVMDRLGRARLYVQLDDDLATGAGTIVFDFHVPLESLGLGEPIGGEVKMPVRLVQMR